MAQTTSGLRSLLSLPSAHRLFQWLVGSPRTRRALAEEYIGAKPGQRLLDIGCGTAEILGYLPEVEYIGFDQNESYIRAAQKRYGARGNFVGRDVNDVLLGTLGSFDVVLALGILHHLDDGETRKLFGLAKSCLKPGGRLVTFDTCYQEGQSSIARFLINRDRGRNTRTEAGYSSLASEVFGTVKSSVRHNLLHIPYTHVILVCNP
jgi:SAM-dependent methyltransferase